MAAKPDINCRKCGHEYQHQWAQTHRIGYAADVDMCLRPTIKNTQMVTHPLLFLGSK